MERSGSKEARNLGIKEGRKEDLDSEHRPHLVLELFFSAVSVVLQLVDFLLAHAYDFAPLPPAKGAETLPFTYHRSSMCFKNITASIRSFYVAHSKVGVVVEMGAGTKRETIGNCRRDDNLLAASKLVQGGCP